MIKNYVKDGQFYALGTSGTREVKVQVGTSEQEGLISMSVSEAEDLMDLLAQAIDHARREVKSSEAVKPQGFTV